MQKCNLTWGLAIATHQRVDALTVTIRLALQQTWPPSEIVVVDASRDWQSTRDRLKPLFETGKAQGIRVVFEYSSCLSTAVQRNRCLDLSDADILFLIDDDSWMFADCAEQIMRIYEADRDELLTSVAAFPSAQPPATISPEKACKAEAERAAPNVSQHSRPVRWVRNLLRADELFVPYDASPPDPRVPQPLRDYHLGTRLTTPGMTMTVRREAACRVHFCDILAGPSYGEDNDFTYRLSKHGSLVTAFNAKLYHAGSPRGRSRGFGCSALKALNQAALHRLYSTDLAASRRRLRRVFARRVVIEAMKDLRGLAISLPHARGYAFALTRLDKILSLPIDTLKQWYPDYQRRLLGWKTPSTHSAQRSEHSIT